MCGSHHRPVALGAARTQVLQHLHRCGRMRAEQFAVAGVRRRNRRADGHVIHRERAERSAQLGVISEVKPAQAFKVAGRPYVHCIGHGGHAGLRLVVAAIEVRRQYRIGIGGQHDLPDRHAQRARQHGRHRIAKVAGRHHQVEPTTMRRVMGQRRMRVITHLRQQAAEADAVGRTQRHLRLQFAVSQCLLDHRLAIVERAGHAQRLDVVAETTELMRLAR